ncbi:MAG: ribosome maturation factor RimP, partial [Alphaproteobacteria bacterium]
MDQAARIGELVEPSLNAMGYELVRVKLSGGDNLRLQIMTERADRAEMTVDDCADISRNISAILDVEDPIKSGYTLEVSSPGIDRPLVRLDDFSRYAGFEARVES